MEKYGRKLSIRDDFLCPLRKLVFIYPKFLALAPVFDLLTLRNFFILPPNRNGTVKNLRVGLALTRVHATLNFLPSAIIVEIKIF